MQREAFAMLQPSSTGSMAMREGCDERRNERLEEMAVLRKGNKTGDWKRTRGRENTGRKREREKGRKEGRKVISNFFMRFKPVLPQLIHATG